MQPKSTKYHFHLTHLFVYSPKKTSPSSIKKSEMGSITDATILHHVCIVLVLLWFLNSFGYGHPVAYFMSLIYLYLVHDGYVLRLTKKLQFEEKRESNQRRVLLDSETVRWLNHAVEKMWLICMEEIVSQKILLPIVPWFLHKYKPWTVKDIEVQNLYLGRSPPIITDMRVLPNSNGDDHLVLELGMNFRTAEDMSAVLGVKLKKRLGFGMLAKLHLLGMHIEGKVLVGVKFIPKWPFIGRLRVCFAGPPYFQMTVKPIFTHGLDVTELPGIAGWIDNLLALVFEQTLVEPNMLVVDVEKFVSPQPENWFSVDAKDPIAHAIVEVIEGADLKPSDLNGLADPYVKGQLGPYRFRTKTRKKTLAPKWREEFKIPICTWESQNMLALEVRDKDRVFDDIMGDCSVNINELRGGQRHDIWLPLQNIKMGRLHLAVTVSEGNEKLKQNVEPSPDADIPVSPFKKTSFDEDSTKSSSFSSKSLEKSEKFVDKFEPIDIEGQPRTGIWIHHPGSEVGQKWEPRKGKIKHVDSRKVAGQVRSEDCELNRTSSKNSSSSTDVSVDAKKPHSQNSFRKGLRKIGSMFQKSPRGAESSVSFEIPEPSEHYNIKAVNTEETGVKLIVDDTDIISHSSSKEEETMPESPKQRHMRDRAKSIMKHAGKSAHSLKNALSRKASRKHNNKAEAVLGPTDENGVLDSNSSDEESLTESAESGLVIPGSNLKTLSGNSSVKPEICTSEIPKDSSIQATNETSGQSTIYHEGTGAEQTTDIHPQ